MASPCVNASFNILMMNKHTMSLFLFDFLERHRIPQFSRFPAGYEVNAEISDLLNPTSPTETLYVHCYIPLKYSFKWIKIVKEIPSEDLQAFAQTTTQQRPGRPGRPTAPPTSHPHHDDDEHMQGDEPPRKSVELDNHEVNENILSERKGEVSPTVEDVAPTVAATSAAAPAALPNYRLHYSSPSWHILLSIGLTLVTSLVSL